MGEMEVGRCECCGKENVTLRRKYFHYPIQCECHSPQHFEMVRHCEECDPKEPAETKITLKTQDLKNPFSFAYKIMKEEMQKTKGAKGDIYHGWQSNLAMMLFDSVPNMTSEIANEIAMKWLDMSFEINKEN